MQGKIRSALPRSPEQRLKELAKADTWTQEPAVAAANALNQATPTPPPSEGVTAFSVRLPTGIADAMRYKAGTTFGMTINKFFVDAVREKLEKEK